MPMNTPEAQKEYQRAWYQRKKAGLETKTKPKLSDEELKRRKSARGKYWHKRSKERRKERKKRLIEAFGERCYFCNSSESERRLAFHEKNGKSHADFASMSEDTFDKVIEKGSFVRLCYGCHKHVHWCMETLKMTWDEMSSRLQ